MVNINFKLPLDIDMEETDPAFAKTVIEKLYNACQRNDLVVDIYENPIDCTMNHLITVPNSTRHSQQICMICVQ